MDVMAWMMMVYFVFLVTKDVHMYKEKIVLRIKDIILEDAVQKPTKSFEHC